MLYLSFTGNILPLKTLRKSVFYRKWSDECFIGVINDFQRIKC